MFFLARSSVYIDSRNHSFFDRMNHSVNTNTPKKYEAIIFDLDGTLYNTANVDVLLRQLKQVKRMSPEYHQIWREIDKSIDGYKEFDGIAEVLQFVREKNVKAVLVTGAVKRRTNKLKRFNLPLMGIVSRFDVSHKKPHPAPMFRALEILGVDASKVLSIGNQVIDLLSSRGAGIDFALASWGVREHEREQLEAESTYVLHDPREIIQMIAE
jgi:phosphoglycolate phosphatase